MAEVDYQKLKERLGHKMLARRLRIDTHHVVWLFGSGRTKIHIEQIRTLHSLIRGVLKTVGFYRRGQRNALAVQVRFEDIPCPELPEEFDGFRILHISDTHIDGNPELLGILSRLIEPLEYDLCVITGDFREGTFEDWAMPARRMAELRKKIRTETYAVPGNHDAIEMVPILEAGGIRMLLNEQVRIERNGQSIRLAGTDDPHYYETDNLDKALEGISDDEFTILLTHSPEIARKAAFAGVDLYLCGHTHAGQICLPGGRPLVANSRCRPDRISGRWQLEEMQGYTSPGAGTSSVNVRFNCPPAITVHRLIRES